MHGEPKSTHLGPRLAPSAHFVRISGLGNKCGMYARTHLGVVRVYRDVGICLLGVDLEVDLFLGAGDNGGSLRNLAGCPIFPAEIPS